MTEPAPPSERERPCVTAPEALEWLMSLDINTASETDRRHAFAVIGELFLPDDPSSLNIADVMCPHRGDYVSAERLFHSEWNADAPTAFSRPARSLWPIVREIYRMHLMTAGIRLIVVANQNTHQLAAVAPLADTAARIFAILDEADS